MTRHTVRPLTPTVGLWRCEYRRDQRRLELASEYMGMPQEFIVVSHVTGTRVKFTRVTEQDPLNDPDGWDGEQCIYRPVGLCPRVDHMIIYNQY
jgi:hypothetical protein